MTHCSYSEWSADGFFSYSVCVTCEFKKDFIQIQNSKLSFNFASISYTYVLSMLNLKMKPVIS